MMRRSWAVLLAVAALVAGACGSDGATPPAGGGTLQQRLESAMEGICRAASLARQGRADEAAAAFNDRAHQFLHDVAPEVQAEDPAAAADLLEAKNRVETALLEARRGETGGQELAGLLDALAASLRRAAAVLEVEAPECGPAT